MKNSPAHVHAPAGRMLPEEDELRELLATVRWLVIARIYSVDVSSVHHAASRMGFGRQPQHLIVGGRSHRALPDDETMRDLIGRMPVREIASRYRVTTNAVYKHLRRIDISGQSADFRKTKLGDVPADDLRRLLETKPWRDLAENLGVLVPTLYYRAKQLGFDRQPAHLRKSRKKPIETGATAMSAYPVLEARP